jgi:hypothetical protein
MQQENLAQIRLRISIICRHILSKHRELLKQINIHEIAENFRRNLATNPPPPLFFKNKSTCIKGKEKKISPSM